MRDEMKIPIALSDEALLTFFKAGMAATEAQRKKESDAPLLPVCKDIVNGRPILNPVMGFGEIYRRLACGSQLVGFIAQCECCDEVEDYPLPGLSSDDALLFFELVGELQDNAQKQHEEA